MVYYTKFHPEHLDYLRAQPAQAKELGMVSSLTGEHLRDTFAYSAFDGGRCIACAGLLHVWPGRAVAWAILAADCNKSIISITRFIKFVLTTHKIARVEATVAVDFAAGHRWMRMLGFEREDRDGLRKYDPHGRTFALYARVTP